jgi:hypothetical protein
MKKNTSTRKIVLRILAEERRRFFSDVVVEVPDDATDDEIEKMWMRSFDGVQDLEWSFQCTSGIWPSGCGTRIHPAVQGDADSTAPVQIHLMRRPGGSLIVVTPPVTNTNPIAAR